MLIIMSTTRAGLGEWMGGLVNVRVSEWVIGLVGKQWGGRLESWAQYVLSNINGNTLTANTTARCSKHGRTSPLCLIDVFWRTVGVGHRSPGAAS